MATVVFAYDHGRDPMNPDQLADQIATAGSLTMQPVVDIDPTSIRVAHPSITEANRASIQALINAYVYDPAFLGDGNLGALQRKAKASVDANNTFLALQSPTNAQTLAQVQRLTREATALIKLVLGDTADTAGT